MSTMVVSKNSVFVLILAHLIKYSSESEILRPRGVSISKSPLYEISDVFSCLDGSMSIPYNKLNDDYCDCPDASDEPGTSACPNGIFHCTNAGFRPKNIKSSLVNDGICDCCDASDEYNSSSQCINNCKELGKLAREQEVVYAALQQAGHENRIMLATEGKQKKEEMKNKISELEKQKEEVVKLKAAKEALKNEIEAKEKEALDKYKSEEEEKKKEVEKEELIKRMAAEREKALEQFKSLDLNGDGKLHFTELMKDLRLDQDRDGNVAEQEAKFFLHYKDYLEAEEFATTGYMLMRPLLTAEYVEEVVTPHPEVAEPDLEMPETPTEIPEMPDIDAVIGKEVDMDPYNDEAEYDPDTGDDKEEVFDDDEEEQDEDQEPNEDNENIATPDMEQRLRRKKMKHDFAKKKEPETENVVYDADTQKLIDEANNARDEFNKVDDELRNIDNEISQLQDRISRDYGPEDEFLTMQDECYEFHHVEYIYKLCTFSRASQVPKSGGGDTSLGTWGRWDGPEDNKYSKMVYENGQGCWNGPARSTQVTLSCGKDHVLKSVAEPRRCVYLFEFETPAVCSKPSLQERNHDEL